MTTTVTLKHAFMNHAKISPKTDTQVPVLETFLFFEIFFGGGLFVVMKANRDAGETPALHIPSDGDNKEGNDHIGVKGACMKFCTGISYLNATTFKNFSSFFEFFRC
ncbi:MAG: hypothetical protein PHY82_00945 [Lentisphaeria bacterium]|nr:hypothetical protein [Lentisphaeria bacterium]